MGSARHVVALACLVIATARTASAEPIPSLDLRGFQPPADPNGALYLEPVATVGPGQWSVGLWTSYANRLVELEDREGNLKAVPVEHQVAVDYSASLGIGELFAVSVTLPTVVYQEGDDTRELVEGGGALPLTALGDAGFGAKVSLVPPGRAGRFALAALGRIAIPTGDQRSYLGEGVVTGDLRLLGELAMRGLALRGSMGGHLRSAFETYLGKRFGHDLPWGIALALRPGRLARNRGERWELHAELHGALAVAPELAPSAQNPVLAGLSARYRVSDVSLLVGGEVPVDAALGAPRARGVLGVGWAPRLRDGDQDGVPDDRDQCSEDPEDRDGYQDEDGCPDPDNDGDGLVDSTDACPQQAEDRDRYQDDDGCADSDNDGDGVPDEEDSCPNRKGVAEEKGCPIPDADRDGVRDPQDWCPERPEDRDGYQDEDGCPDLDNDGDDMPDSEDACRDEPGVPHLDTSLHGCPNPDRDGDTFDNAEDECPDEPEDFDGIDDGDGCADPDASLPANQRHRPLIVIEERDAQPVLIWRTPPRVVREGSGVRVAAESEATLRAVGRVLNENPQWVVLVGVRPRDPSGEAQSEALNASFALANALRRYTHRDDAAESVGWDAVALQPRAGATGVGMLVVVGSQPERP